MIGATELMVVGGILVLLFGAKKLPEFARSLGEAKAEFSRASTKAPEPKPATPAVPPAPSVQEVAK